MSALLQSGPLAGLRVLDVTHMLAGPYGTWILGALGADVIKVERVGHGDHVRSLAPKLDGESLYFLSVNRNKRSLAVDLKAPAGRRIFEALARQSDILVENNRPGAMARLGLGPEQMLQVNPRLIYASISGFGQTGPYRERPAFDAVVQAMGGMMSLTGEPGRGAVRVGASIGDMTASLFSVIGILAAVQERSRTGKGTVVDVAMLDAQVSLLENAFSRYLNTGAVPGRIGTRHPLVTPFQAFDAIDGPFVVCCDTEPQWRALCKALWIPEIAEDPRFADNTARTQNHGALEPILADVFAKGRRAEWLELLGRVDVPCGPINSIAEVAEDPQIVARDMLVTVGKGRFAAQPIKMPSLAGTAATPAPAVGGDTDDVLAELGYSPADVARLVADGVVSRPPD